MGKQYRNCTVCATTARKSLFKFCSRCTKYCCKECWVKWFRERDEKGYPLRCIHLNCAHIPNAKFAKDCGYIKLDKIPLKPSIKWGNLRNTIILWCTYIKNSLLFRSLHLGIGGALTYLELEPYIWKALNYVGTFLDQKIHLWGALYFPCHCSEQLCFTFFMEKMTNPCLCLSPYKKLYLGWIIPAVLMPLIILLTMAFLEMFLRTRGLRKRHGSLFDIYAYRFQPFYIRYLAKISNFHTHALNKSVSDGIAYWFFLTLPGPILGTMAYNFIHTQSILHNQLDVKTFIFSRPMVILGHIGKYYQLGVQTIIFSRPMAIFGNISKYWVGCFAAYYATHYILSKLTSFLQYLNVDMNMNMDMGVDMDADTKLYMDQQNIKTCTACGIHLVRISGCNHMICQCGHNFCYGCNKDWMDATHINCWR